ncbi:MAG TPA: DmsC/YnfH family molybdoenzyme membrane anchor subunit [Bryobacteraceae bacterium]|nr:DmsC/YnfH family molybdoenzyme membrane anchor subunit [Bryobacteraceae bacterium]
MSTVELPLLGRQDLVTFSTARLALTPSRLPESGEQYRFHFDVEKCIGCKCCVVACNEQNGNPAEINWRRVGEIEGGVFPLAQRWHLSMGCNHCVEPSCMLGCPVEAYSKDALTGIVDHNPDQCIGCQYCTWNCSYGVPQFNAERGVVGKCDMCHSRLTAGAQPACVNACPSGAIAIEIVDVAAWRLAPENGNAPGLPSVRDSLSTTRITMPAKAAGLFHAISRVDEERVQPEHAHASLVFLLVFIQMAAGAMGAIAIAGSSVAWLAAGIAMFALAAAPMHLGRPIHAHRAWRGWKTSWLSREVISFGLFAKTALAAAWFGTPVTAAAACVAGLFGIYCSARIYTVPARPAWNSWLTLADFYLTAFVLGPTLLLALSVIHTPTPSLLGLLAQFMLTLYRRRAFAISGVVELRSTAGLLDHQLRPGFIIRLALLAAAIIALPNAPIAAFLFALLSELENRALFFQSVVGKSAASAFLTPGGRAA